MKAYGGWWGVFYKSEDPGYRDALLEVFSTRRKADVYVLKQIKELEEEHAAEWAKYLIKRVKIST